jgi:hypothetical protein
MLKKDRCTVCAERAIWLEIIFVHPMELLGYVDQVKAILGLFGDSVDLGTG